MSLLVLSLFPALGVLDKPPSRAAAWRISLLSPGFVANLTEEIYCSLDHARSAHSSGRVVFWDMRTPGEFDSTEARNNPQPGTSPVPSISNGRSCWTRSRGTVKIRRQPRLVTRPLIVGDAGQPKRVLDCPFSASSEGVRQHILTSCDRGRGQVAL